ncbi:hypothetical protein BDN72DRAFT_962323 [Pluteus cervinus]|uniref:Uncharacterized protein n=1 Tax=Pluteus cervinus TaxID=181527 RepID=A0ACD3AJK5_9AGAR|nr:hypothetical protein BDN72DRAFT_962323 [Pluteus cervinus]
MLPLNNPHIEGGPDLPNEILGLIFSFFPSGGVANPDELPHFRRHTFDQPIELSHSLGTLLVISRVCQRWRDVVSRYLYQNIRIRSFSDLVLLATAVERKEIRSHHSRSTPIFNRLGEVVRRLDVYSMFGVTTTIYDAWKLFDGLIQCLPNLQMLCFRQGFDTLSIRCRMPSYVVESMARTFSGSLEVLLLQTDSCVPDFQDLVGLLISSPQIRMLKFVTSKNVARVPTWYTLPHPPMVFDLLPKLSSLSYTPTMFPHGAEGNLRFPGALSPQLKYLSLRIGIHHTESILRDHGSSLVYVQLIDVIHLPQLAGLLPFIATHCPRVVHLDVGILSLWYPLILHVPPSIEILGFSIWDADVGTTWKGFVDTVLSIQAPGLKTLFLRNESDLKYAREKWNDDLWRIARGLEQAEVRFEDHQGRLICTD